MEPSHPEEVQEQTEDAEELERSEEDSDRLSVLSRSTSSYTSSSVTSCSSSLTSSEHGEDVLFPGFLPVSLYCMTQENPLRYWCLRLITNPWFERVSMMVILLNCVTLGMYQPCIDDLCLTNKCQILQGFDHFIFAFFAIEMLIKMTAMGMTGKGAYLSETWNRLDCFIVISGAFEYCLDVGSINLSAIRTIRVLRPLRAINRIPSMRILVMLLLDTLPMLGNVLLLCFFVFFIFGIVGVQLWSGLLRHRCHVDLPPNVSFPTLPPLSTYYHNKEPEKDYICSKEKDNGMHRCHDLPPLINNGLVCNISAAPFSNNTPSNTSCANWNQYYTDCRPGDKNPFQGAISFDNIGLAWVAIFLVISLEGWTDIMYYIQDAHSFWDWIYFVLLIVIGSFFMINLCLVVIATQFSETKKREMERMKMERARYHSNSTLYSNSGGSEPVGCYTETLKYLAHLCRRAKRRTLRWYRQMRRRRRKDQEHRLPRSISLRRTRQRPPWQPGQSSLKRQDATTNNNNNYSETISCGPQAGRSCDSLHAPCASPEVSDIDPLASPRRPNLLKIPHDSSGDVVKPSDCTVRIETTEVEQPQKSQPSQRLLAVRTGNKHPSNGSSRRTSQLTCAELLALSGAQSAALAASLASNYAMQKFYCTLTRGEKNYSAPQLLFYYPENNSEPASQVDDIWTESDFESDLEDDLCTEHRGQCFAWWQSKQSRLKRFVDHQYFQRGILAAILVNTLSMGIEYHNQPEELTLAVEISNLVFTAIFALEMLLKILAEGFFGYISSGFNVFDGVIVVLSILPFIIGSVVELFQSSGSGLSVLRTFRLLRILKLVRFMPALRRQLVIMLRTLDNVAIFFSLLILFIFIFSCLGMHLFGGCFCTRDNDGQSCTCEDLANVEVACVCDRKHFDNFLWATVTVFQVLTQEDWNIVLFNGMEKTSHWAALYFVALMTFGNYVLFNLLVAILVEGFSTQGEDRKTSDDSLENKKPTDQEKGDMIDQPQIKHISDDDDPKDNIIKETRMRSHPPALAVTRSEKLEARLGDSSCFPPIITHTAATPQGSPNATMEPFMRDLNNKLSPLMAFNISASSIDSIDKSSNPICFPDSPLLTRSNSNKSSGSACLSIPRAAVCCTPELLRRDTIPITDRRTPSPSRLVRQFSAKRNERKGSQGSITRLDRQGSICSWRALRRRKKLKEHLVDSDSGSITDDEEIILNNMTSVQLISGNCHSIDYRHCNGGVAVPTFFNTPNNKRPIATMHNPINSPKTLSPQNSIRSHSSPMNISRKESVNSYHAPLSPQNSLGGGPGTGGNSYLPSRQNSIAGSLKEEFKSNNLGELPQTKFDNIIFLEKPEIHSKLCFFLEPRGCFKDRDDYSLFLFAPENKARKICTMLTDKKWFDYIVLVFIALNCITLAMERPNIPPESVEKLILNTANYIFTFVFGVEMLIKVIAKGLWYGEHAYFKSGWNVMDGTLVIVSLVDLFLSFVTFGSTRIFGILRVFRLLRSLRPLRVINRAPGLKLVVQTLLSSLRPIGNIVLICCTFFIIFGILGVQLFKGSLFYCVGPDVRFVRNKTDCLSNPKNAWVNRRYNFDNLGQALMALFVLSSKDGWVNIMYSGLDAVGVDQQPQENYSEWRLLYFISFLLLVAFFVLNMFVGVVVENFHRCREEQEKEEKARRMAKRARKLEKKRRSMIGDEMREPPYYINYSKPRLLNHNIVTSKYFDLAIAAVIGLNVVTMAMEFYMMPPELEYALKIFNYFFTAVFILEAIMKVIALGVPRYLHDRWNQLDIFIVILSVVGIVLEEMESEFIPINPTIIRVMRVLRIARVLKLLKMAKGIRALLDTVMQALPQVGNLGLLFFLLFFIFAALGVELFGRLECTEEFPCQGLGEHAHFRNFGMAFLTLFRVATGDNWNGIMKDTLRDNCDASSDCVRNCCVSPIIAPLYFVVFVLMAQFVLVNVVVAVLMKHLEESHKQMDDDLELEIEQELVAEAEREPVRKARRARRKKAREKEQLEVKAIVHRPIVKMSSLPANFTFNFDPKLNDANEFPTSVAIHVTDAGLEEASQANLSPVDPYTTANNLTPPASSFPVNSVNIRQASPDEPIKTVAVADLSHIPLSTLGSVPNLVSSSTDLCFSPPELPRSLPGSVYNLHQTLKSPLSSCSTSLSEQAQSCPSSPMRAKSPLEARMSWQSPSEYSSYLENAENQPSLSEISCPTYPCSSGSTRSGGVPSLEKDRLVAGATVAKEAQSPTISEGSDWTSESSRTLENLLNDDRATPDGGLDDLSPRDEEISEMKTTHEGTNKDTPVAETVLQTFEVETMQPEAAESLPQDSETRGDQLTVRHPLLAAVAHKLDKTYSESSDETLKADHSGTATGNRSSLETQEEDVERETSVKELPADDSCC